MNLPVLQPHKDGTVLAVRVSPNASRSKFTGLYGDELKIAIQAPPVDGAANKELIKFLSKQCKIPKQQISILSGETSRSKRVLFSRIGKDDLQAMLERLI